MTQPTDAARFYDRFAPHYDRAFQSYLRPSYDLMLEALDPNPGERLLDIGAGTGELELRLCKRVKGLEMVGIEPAPAMAVRAREKLAAASCPARILDGFFEDHDSSTLGTFDYVVACNILHFLTDPGAAIARWATAVKPGGHLAVVTLDGAVWPFRIGQPFLRMGLSGYTSAHPLAEVESYFRDAGLAVTMSGRRRFSPFFGALLVRGRTETPVGA